ncbi:cytosolic phospholipase A2 gamma-like [Gadus chalcogrammus]|uniref:cytosolic phospholipase A2 gamma-like n=1 Tax=Gadus chalcogrammus TaxID=1042646 RepID=UPI0024C48313|nr:cytosolic phospholipase A2 gamma-like [Gadus chalcogrammus]
MAQVRIQHSLSDGEKNYLSVRKPCVQKCLVKNNIPCTLSKVPNIAILGSGGGERAMVGLLGSLSQMGEQGLLDAALYMSGVSGSTWCMASLYEKPNWSSDMEHIKVIAERLGHGSVSLKDRVLHLIGYYRANANFSLTDVWSALVVPAIVKKIDKSTLSNYKTCHDKDPYPIYTVINQDCKYEHLLRETFFELTPHEAGYTLAGAFVETSNFGSIFNEGVLTKPKPEMDMTYLQGLCGSAPADKEVILKILKEWLEGGENMKALKDHKGVQLLSTVVDLQLCQYTGCDPAPLLKTANELLLGKMGLDGSMLQLNFDGKNSAEQNEQIHRVTSAASKLFFEWNKDLVNLEVREELGVFVKTHDKVTEKSPDKLVGGGSKVDELLKKFIDRVKKEAVALQSHAGPRLMLQVLELYYGIHRGEDWTHLVVELNTLLKGKKTVSGSDLMINEDEWLEADLKSRKKLAHGLSLDICKSFWSWFPDLKNAIWDYIVKKILQFFEGLLKYWIWGTNYNYLHRMNAPHIDKMLLQSETTHFEDAGLLVNSPYMSALRAEREIDLIISFDFSAGNPMETLTETAEECKDLDISFPKIQYTTSDVSSPKGFYVFKGPKKAPTVIHIPLFNVDNCGSKLEDYIKKYGTFQGAYSPEMIEDLIKKAGENVLNNKETLLGVIKDIIEQK